MTTYEQLPLFTNMPQYDAVEGQNRSKREPRWYYVADARNERMLASNPRGDKSEWKALDLSDPAILLFNSHRVAQEAATKLKGHIRVYPYDLNAMRTKWKCL